MTKKNNSQNLNEIYYDIAECKPGYIRDLISGYEVKATPEEVEAVQVFARRLVEDYGYEPLQIQTRPQFRVRKSPADVGKTYPVDIAVFHSNEKIEENLMLIVECKKKTHREGLTQLKLYLDMSPAYLGVWFNGDEHVYIRKVHHKDGSRTYEDLPNIPRKGERIEDIGLYRRKDLKKPSNLKAIFRDIRNHLAGMTTGITRDEALAQEIVAILFCKIFDEQNCASEEIVEFRVGIGEPAEEMRLRILNLFEKVKSATFGDVFSKEDTITLDAESLSYVVGELQNYCIMDADRDAVGDAFEIFIGPALRGSEGQFFTPRNVVKMMVEMLNPKPGEKIIDPACGSGGFLINALEYVWTQLKIEAENKGWSNRQLIRRELEVSIGDFRGIDKDAFLAQVTKAYMAIVGDGRGGIFCENALLPNEDWDVVTQEKISLGSFDVVLTNPPFGSKIPVKGRNVLAQYELGYKWKKNRKTGKWEKTNTLLQSQSPQILFLERCLQLMKDGGKMGVVLPESILGNPSYGYIVQYLRERTKILAIVAMPESLFKTSGKGGTHCKTCVVFLQKELPSENYAIFMAEAKWCGHDSRGNRTFRKAEDGKIYLLDDIPTIAKRYKEAIANPQDFRRSHLGYWLDTSKIFNDILIPKYYDPEIKKELQALRDTHDLLVLSNLIDNGIISITTGDEVGKMAYGTGKIPFIRTSDISNWELKIDAKQGVSEAIYEKFADKQDVQAGDIFLVRDGTYLIGTCCMVTEHDLPLLYQSHIYKLRVLNNKFNKYLLLATLNSPVVKRQIRSKQFTQDIIDTLGQRITEIILPIPKNSEESKDIAEETKRIIELKAELRRKQREVAIRVQGGIHAVENLEEVQ